jgi:hypothetical protein
MIKRPKLTLSYRVLNDTGTTLEVIKEVGYNKKYIEWLLKRKLNHRYKNQNVRFELIKIVREIA